MKLKPKRDVRKGNNGPASLTDKIDSPVSGEAKSCQEQKPHQALNCVDPVQSRDRYHPFIGTNNMFGNKTHLFLLSPHLIRRLPAKPEGI